MLSGLAIKLALAFGLMSAIGGGVMYVKLLQARLDLAVENQAKLEGVVTAQKEVFDRQTADIEKMRKLNDEVNKQFAAAAKEKDNLQRRFNQTAGGNSRDIGALAIQRPALTEAAINTTTKYIMRCVEIATGDALRETDKSNNICPDLVK